MRVITKLIKEGAPDILVRTHGAYGEMYALMIGDKVATVVSGADSDRIARLIDALLGFEAEGYITEGADDRASGINQEIARAFVAV
jgi:hypothetical protein